MNIAIVNETVTAVALEYWLVFFLIGMLIVLISCALLILYAVTHSGGYKVQATLLGAIVRPSNTSEPAKHEPHLVVRYLSRQGRSRIETASELPRDYQQFTTGQQLSIIVHTNKEYDDVYFANNKGLQKLGILCLLVGFVLLALASLSIIVIASIAATLLLFSIPIMRYLRRIDASDMPLPDHKVFQLHEIKTIEDLKGIK